METLTKTKAEEKQEEKQARIKPPQQPVTVERLNSNERTSTTSVFGTSTPTSGLRGFIRRMASRYSESGFGHWFPLIFADRINIWEGFLHSKKRRLKAELKYNKKQFLAKTGTSVLIGAFVFAWLMTSSRRKKLKGKR